MRPAPGSRQAIRRGLALAVLAIAAAGPALTAPADDRFREANDLVRSGDYPKAIALYGELAASGQESASLYWNWAQAATARGGAGRGAVGTPPCPGAGSRRPRRGARRGAAARGAEPRPRRDRARAARRRRADRPALPARPRRARPPRRLRDRPRPGPGRLPGGGERRPGPLSSSASWPPPSRSPRPSRARRPPSCAGGPRCSTPPRRRRRRPAPSARARSSRSSRRAAPGCASRTTPVPEAGPTLPT